MKGGKVWLTLKQLRLSRLLTQEAVARAVGVTQQTVATWEKGERYPQLTQMAKLAQFFGLSTDEITRVIDESMAAKEAD